MACARARAPWQRGARAISKLGLGLAGRYGRRGCGGGGVGRAGGSTAAVPPLAAQRPSDGGPVRNVPSLHCIVAPGGGSTPAGGAALSAAGAVAALLAAVGVGGVLPPGILTARPPRRAHVAGSLGAMTNVPSLHWATALAGIAVAAAAAGRTESGGRPARPGGRTGSAGWACAAAPAGRVGATVEGGGGVGGWRSGSGCAAGGVGGGAEAGAWAAARAAPKASSPPIRATHAMTGFFTSFVMATP